LARVLVLRPDQMDALAAPHRERFVRKTLENLARVFPGDSRLADEASVRALIDDAWARAAGYGLARERELALFIYLVFEHGPGFERQAGCRWMQSILTNGALDGPMKMDLIYARLQKA
jgi:hypothetical protein